MGYCTNMVENHWARGMRTASEGRESNNFPFTFFT